MSKAKAAEKRGTKREREEGSDEEVQKELSRRTRRKVERKTKPPVDPKVKAERRLRGAQASVLKTAKAAKLFETQRLVKKLKQARIKKNDEDLVAKLEVEFDVVKDADPHEICNEALARAIKKDAQLSHDEHCMAALPEVIPPEQQVKHVPAEHKTGWNRLLSSKKLARGIHHVMLSLKKEFARNEKREEMLKRIEQEKEERQKAGKLSNKERKALDKEMKRLRESGDKADAEDDERVNALLQTADDDDSEDEDIAIPNEGSDAESDDEDGDESDEEDAPKPTKVASKGKDVKMDDAEDEEDEEDEEEDEDGEKSQFLPSLATGFVSGSDSEYDEKAEDVDGPERKNRRGQRARKAIWEKKYGKNANHLKKQREEMQAAGNAPSRGGFDRGRGRGRGGRGGARGGGGYQPGPSGFDPRNVRKGGRGRGGRGGPVDSGWAGRRDFKSSQNAPPPAHAAPAPAPKPAPEKPMHPSWQAKKNEKAAGAAVAAQGKKIVFGD